MIREANAPMSTNYLTQLYDFTMPFSQGVGPSPSLSNGLINLTYSKGWDRVKPFLTHTITPLPLPPSKPKGSHLMCQTHSV